MNTNSVVSLAGGELRAIFWPQSGMLCASFCHRGAELLRRIDDLEVAKSKGSTAGIPLLYPWANRLASLGYHAGGHDVALDPSSPLLHFDDHGLPMHGVPWGKLAWEVVEVERGSVLARLAWEHPDLLAIFPYPPLAESLFAAWEDALLFRTLATLRVDVPVFTSVDDLQWRGPTEDFKGTCERMKAADLFQRALATNAHQRLP